MRPVLTPQEARDLDRATQQRGVSALDLMERAGRAVARGAAEAAGGVYGRRAVVVCGRGNNGGDGFVAARCLARDGMRVDVLEVEPASGGAGPTRTNRARLSEQGLQVRAWTGERGRSSLARADVVLDALFGTGFRGGAEGDWGAAIEAIAGTDAPTVSVDIPSGVDGATGAVQGPAVRADLTVTFGAVKTGCVLLPGAEHAGTIRVVDIGFADDLMPHDAGLIEAADVASVVPTRVIDGHKRRSGVLLVVAGSRRMTGAPALIARAAARMGAGLVTVAAPEEVLRALQAQLAEAVFLPLPQTSDGSVSRDALDPALAAAAAADAVAIGPGLGRDPDTEAFVRDLVSRCPVPLVLDADGANAFEGAARGLRDRVSKAVLTPHDGEFSRLMGHRVDDESDRVAAVRALATATDAVALLKGTRTVISSPDGAARINVTGTPVLATAGTGDVLTGAIGALVARGVGCFDAACAGAFLHGVAGRLEGERRGEGAVAGDVIERLPEAISIVAES
jgi:NAD(P)H-hydrate epimerase